MTAVLASQGYEFLSGPSWNLVADVQNMLAVAVDTFGRLDILHNNARIDGAVANTG